MRRETIRAPKEHARIEILLKNLEQFERGHNLAGLTSERVRSTFIAQVVDSIRRAEYVQLLRSRDISPASLEIGRQFDPLRGAILMDRQGNHDEACWLVFLSAHFARHRKTGWKLAGDFYNKMGSSTQWTWRKVSAAPNQVATWLDDNHRALRAAGGRFGNHRKYESLRGEFTGRAVITYVDWVGTSHRDLFDHAGGPGASPPARFAAVYKSMSEVARFGRVGRFDYLTMLYKLDLAEIRPDRCYLGDGATGPRTGAELLLYGGAQKASSVPEMEGVLADLGDALGTTPDILEDALCNWQKSPAAYSYFSG